MEKEERLLKAVDDFMHNHVLPGIRPDDINRALTALVTEK
jgi:hypothetical protein